MNIYNLSFCVGIPSTLTEQQLVLAAVKRAYSDMSRRTLFFSNKDYIGDGKIESTNREKLKEYVKNAITLNINILYKDLINANQNKQTVYDDWHNKTCIEIVKIFTTRHPESNNAPMQSSEELLKLAKTQEQKDDARKYGFSYGQAQKILNMTMKYVYIFMDYYNTLNITNYSKFVQNFEKVFIPVLHSPIDRIVIDNAAKKKWLGLKIPALSWSQMDEATYKNYQTNLRIELAKKYQNTDDKCPFMWELKNYPFN